MSTAYRIAEWITAHATLVLLVTMLLSAVFAVGLAGLETDSSLAQFEGDSSEREALAATSDRFAADDAANETTVQIAVRGEDADVLSRESLLETLELQRAIREDDAVAPTLVDESPTTGLETVVATSLVHEDEIAALEERADELERRERRLTATAEELQTSLETVRDLQREYDRLNASHEAGEIDDATYRTRADELDAEIAGVVEAATADLDAEETRAFERAVGSVRSTQEELSTLDRTEFASGAAYRQYRDRLEDDLSAAYTDGTAGVLSDEYGQLRDEYDRLRADQRALETAGEPPLSEQIEALESVNDSAYDEALERALEDDDGPFAGLALEFLPVDYDPGSEGVETRLVVVTQELDPDGDETGLDALEERHVEGQGAIGDLADNHALESSHEYAVFGFGLFTDEIDRSLTDSLVIVGPLAVVFVVLALSVAYRDPLDVALGVVGILVVLLWTFGIAGWAGIAINQALVAVPVLLIGLSIDYAVHVIMRYREHRGQDRPTTDGRGVRRPMAVALAGVGIALAWVTVTTAIGFLSNLVAPVAPIREFGLVSAVGIVAALVVFGAAVPAANVHLDAWLERRDVERRRRAFGTGPRLGAVLSIGAHVAHRAPVAVLVCGLVVTAGGAYGAATVDTSLDERDFLVEEPPDWASHLPDRIAPGEYRANQDLAYLEDRFQHETPRAQVYVEGDVTDPETIRRLATAQNETAEMETAAPDPAGGVAVESPLTVMEDVADDDETFDASFQVADRSDDGVPDRNVEILYDRLFDIDPDAAGAVVHRTEDGEYESVRLLVDVRGDADGDHVTAETRALADAIDPDDPRAENDGTGTAGDELNVTATATGEPVVAHVLERDVLAAMAQSLAITLVAIAAILSVSYWLSGAGAAFGVVTVLPVAVTVPWILGTMALVDVPLNALTATITSLTVGLGVAYCIHVSSRYRLELERGSGVRDALTTTVRATGGALLASAATTIGGVATLLVAFVPVLRQFGVVTGLMIAYAFLASVVLLPALLVLWTRLFRPDAIRI